MRLKGIPTERDSTSHRITHSLQISYTITKVEIYFDVSTVCKLPVAPTQNIQIYLLEICAEMRELNKQTSYYENDANNSMGEELLELLENHPILLWHQFGILMEYCLLKLS